MMADSTALLLNREAGGHEAAKPFLESLRGAGTSIHALEELDSMEEFLAACPERGIRRVILAGGDGTLHHHLDTLQSFPDLVYGVLPLGTGNDLARSLGLPLELEACWEELSSGQVRSVDIGRYHHSGRSHSFHNALLGGQSVDVSKRADPDLKSLLGPVSYAVSSLDAILQGVDRYEVRLTLDGETQDTMILHNLFVGNGRTVGGGFVMYPDARLDDGFLDVLLVPESTSSQLAQVFAAVAFDSVASGPGVIHHRVRELRVDSDPPMPFTVDGQILEPGTLAARIEPAALKVLVGRDAPALPAPIDDPGPIDDGEDSAP